MNVVAGDEVYPQTERDPWIFYDCGKQRKVIITADKDFMNLFPHMAAISLGNTTVIAFTSNDYNSEVRGKAFIQAKNKILRAIRDSKGASFIGSVGMNGTFSIVERSPAPNRRYCDERDWKSYKRACEAEGVKFEKPVAGSPDIRRSGDGHTQDQAGTEAAEERARGKEAG
jgi:hypothetical protein